MENKRIKTTTTSQPETDDEMMPPRAEWISATLKFLPTTASELALKLEKAGVETVGMFRHLAKVIKDVDDIKNPSLVLRDLGLNPFQIRSLYHWAHPPMQELMTYNTRAVVLKLVGPKLNKVPQIQELDSILHRAIPPEFPVRREVFNLICDLCPQKYDKSKPHQIFFLKIATDVLPDPRDLSIESMISDYAQYTSGRSENTVHAPLTNLVQYFLLPLLQAMNAGWIGRTICNVTRNHREPIPSRTTCAANIRPDWAMFIHSLLVFRGEEEGDSSRVSIDVLAHELIKKIELWNPLYFGDVPYVFGYASVGLEFQLYALFPRRDLVDVRYQSYNVGIQKLGEQLDLAKIQDRFLLWQYLINLVPVFEQLAKLVPGNVPSLDRKWPGKHHPALEFFPKYVRKTATWDPIIQVNFELLSSVYDLIRTGKIQYTIQCEQGYPKMEGAAIISHLYPLGRAMVPSTATELKDALTCVLRALVSMHANYICHRDVARPNVAKLLDESWILIDLDYCAKLVNGKASWPEWDVVGRQGRPLPTFSGDEQNRIWSAAMDVEQVAMMVEELTWFVWRNELAKRLRATTSTEDALNVVERFNFS